MKICSRCKTEKDEGEFGKRGYTKQDGSQSLSSWCKDCCREHYKSNYEENKKKQSRRMKDAYDADPEKFRKRSRDWREKNPEKAKVISQKGHEKKDRFVVALQSSRRAAKCGGYEPCNATVEEIKAAYTGRCEVCGISDQECIGKFHMHHSHLDGSFSGWLCGNCNKGIGFLKDSEELLINALHLVMRSKVK